MSLRKPASLTPAMRVARRLNALQSTGPRTERGKRYSRINALKTGRFTRDFRGLLSGAGVDLWLLDWIHARLWDHYHPLGAHARRRVELMAREVWCRAWHDPRVHRLGGFSSREGMSRALLQCLETPSWLPGMANSKPRSRVKSVDTSITSSPFLSLREAGPVAPAAVPVSVGLADTFPLEANGESVDGAPAPSRLEGRATTTV